MIRNPAKLREPSKEEGIISSTDTKSVCSQEVITSLRPETYTQSLLNVPNGYLVAVKINASNVQTNGQVSFQLHHPGMTDELFKGGGIGVERCTFFHAIESNTLDVNIRERNSTGLTLRSRFRVGVSTGPLISFTGTTRPTHRIHLDFSPRTSPRALPHFT
ncbi:hypothetical protein TNCV_4258891 [Trichonephila clavipes]|nr:hypothetical protein TNCV_4258891 [Trichonephila clavipes]